MQWHDALGAIGLWLGAAAVLASAAYYATAAAVPRDGQAPALAAVLVAYLTLPLAALVVYHPSGLRERLAVKPGGARAYGTAILLWLIALTACVGLYLLIGAVTGHLAGPLLDTVREATDYSRFPTATAVDWALIVPRALLLAGMTEELLFRGIIFGWLRQHLPWWPTAAITAVLFAAIHGYYPVVVPLALLFGISLAWLREQTGSVLPGVLTHILTDSLLFVLALTIA